MAEAVLRHKVAAAGLSEQIEVDSAGTGDWHIGKAPHYGTLGILGEKGINAEGMVGRQVSGDDLAAFHYVLTMDARNLAGVQALNAPSVRATVAPLMEYAPETGVEEVPDPYLTGGFPEVYRLIDAACDGLLSAIRRDHGL